MGPGKRRRQDYPRQLDGARHWTLRLALLLLEEMQAEGIPANTITYSAAISACGKGAQWQRALLLLEDMQAEGVPADTITYSAASATGTPGPVQHDL